MEFVCFLSHKIIYSPKRARMEFAEVIVVWVSRKIASPLRPSGATPARSSDVCVLSIQLIARR